MLGRYKITQKAAQDAIRHFTDWHKLWNKVNKMPKGSIGIVPLPTPEEQAEKALDELDASREPDEISAGQPPERSIGEAPVMQAPVPENPEDDVESLQEKMIESDTTSAGDGSDIAAPFGKTISEDDEKRNRKRVIFFEKRIEIMDYAKVFTSGSAADKGFCRKPEGFDRIGCFCRSFCVDAFCRVDSQRQAAVAEV